VRPSSAQAGSHLVAKVGSDSFFDPRSTWGAHALFASRIDGCVDFVHFDLKDRIVGVSPCHLQARIGSAVLIQAYEQWTPTTVVQCTCAAHPARQLEKLSLHLMQGWAQFLCGNGNRGVFPVTMTGPLLVTAGKAPRELALPVTVTVNRLRSR